MLKQQLMFENETPVGSDTYTNKISAPIYEPKNVKPHLFTLCDKSKSSGLIQEIEKSNLPDLEKQFLIDAALRLNVFNYELIADYYSHSSAEMQGFMEKMALVIIDFEKAIELGFVQLSEDIRSQYFEFYDEQ